MKVNIYEAVLSDMDLSHYRGAEFRFEGDVCHLDKNFPSDTTITEEQFSFLVQTGVIPVYTVITHPHKILPHKHVRVGEKIVYFRNRWNVDSWGDSGLDHHVLAGGMDPRELSSSYSMEDRNAFAVAIFPNDNPPDMTGWVQERNGRWWKNEG